MENNIIREVGIYRLLETPDGKYFLINTHTDDERRVSQRLAFLLKAEGDSSFVEQCSFFL